MLALEDAFDVEFPERMLRRQTFESVASIHEAIGELVTRVECLSRPVTERRRGDAVPPLPPRHPRRTRRCPSTLAAIAARIGVDDRGPVRGRGRPRRPLPRARRSTRCAPSACSRCSFPSSSAAPERRIAEVAAAVEALGRHCASTAMIYAMHQIQVASIVRHGRSAWARDYLRDVAERELLLASATTETGIGGDVRSSSCAVERDGDRFRLEKDAPVISYGAYADAVLVTARRTPDSPPNDQVLVVVPTTPSTLEERSGWDTLGFRGTCSNGFLLRAEGDVDQILSDPYGDISSQHDAADLARRVGVGVARASPARRVDMARSSRARRGAPQARARRRPPRCGSRSSSVATKSSGRWCAHAHRGVRARARRPRRAREHGLRASA